MPKFQDQRASLKLKEGCDKLNWDCSEIPRWYKYDSKNPAFGWFNNVLTGEDKRFGRVFP